MQFDWSAIWPAIPILLEGAKMTLWISVLGLAGGLIIGLVAGFARCFGGWIANHIALVFIEIIRGTGKQAAGLRDRDGADAFTAHHCRGRRNRGPTGLS